MDADNIRDGGQHITLPSVKRFGRCDGTGRQRAARNGSPRCERYNGTGTMHIHQYLM